MRTLATELFKEMVGRPESQVDLASAALSIALDEYPALDIQKCLSEIDAMASVLRSEIDFSVETRSLDTIERLNRFLFHTRGFRGNTEDYYDPRNSYLNEVLERRLGIPITLSLVFMEVGKRLGLRLEGVGMPGHFIVKCFHNGSEVFIDPFNQGEILMEDECRKRLELQYGTGFQFSRSLLDSVNKHQILTRMLANLKGIYLQRQEFRKALGAIEKIVFINPKSHTEIRDRAAVHFKLSNLTSALADWVRYLEMQPNAPDAEEIKNQMKVAGQLLALRN
jgi:regulator of sirC expression with transglutaminase-like and TPR domain